MNKPLNRCCERLEPVLILRSVAANRYAASLHQSPQYEQAPAPSFPAPVKTVPLSDPTVSADTDLGLCKWIHAQYHESFTKVGFIGWNKFQDALEKARPKRRNQIGPTMDV
jgi:hypothetical protein